MNYVHENISRYSICGIVTLIVKMNCNRTDFAVGADSHVRPPDSGSGSDNVVHISFSKVATGISQNRWIIRFPGKSAVMGVTTKVKVNTGSSCLVQFFWLMVNENNWFSLVQRFGKLGRSGSGAFYFSQREASRRPTI